MGLKICELADGGAFLHATQSGLTQTIRVAKGVLDQVVVYRQSAKGDYESGGQLFGVISRSQVLVLRATGPYPGDTRGRYSYRSEPMAAQKAIEAMHAEGLLYLGEWHTHAENFPSPSTADSGTMDKILRKSILNTNLLVLLIVGRNEGPAGLSLSIACKNQVVWL